MGVPRSLTVATLNAGGNFTGANDCSIAVRRADGVALLRLMHRDAGDGAILWHNHVRLTRAEPGTILEHAIIRSAPRDVVLDPRASSPRINQELIKAYGGGGIRPRDLYTATTLFEDPSSTVAFVEHVLLDRARDVPVVVVTPAAFSGALAVDPTPLAKRLRGMAMMAMMATLSTRECTRSCPARTAPRHSPTSRASSRRRVAGPWPRERAKRGGIRGCCARAGFARA